VVLFGFGVHQLLHIGRPASYRLNMLVDTEPNRQILARRIAAEARKRGLEIELSPGLEDDPDAPPDPDARRAYLLDQLEDLKSEAIRDFADGGLKGEGLLAGVVALVNDTRISLAAGNRTPHLHPVHLDVQLGEVRSAAGSP
jgi:hypothetical protein